MSFTIVCKKLTDENCDFVARGETREETKSNFYAHGAGSPLHRERYRSATEKDKAEFAKKLDEYLAQQY